MCILITKLNFWLLGLKLRTFARIRILCSSSVSSYLYKCLLSVDCCEPLWLLGGCAGSQPLILYVHGTGLEISSSASECACVALMFYTGDL